MQIVKSFSENSHFSVQLFDDIADSITYCNHYLAPVKVRSFDRFGRSSEAGHSE